METKANYVLIGAFTLAGFAGILAFFLWFASVELDRQFAYYDINFTSVSGLGNASDVRFSGLPVGQVVEVKLSPERDGTIAVRVEVAANTPVRTDSIATIEAQGVTGVSFVSIGPGTPEGELIEQPEDGAVPTITAGRSTLQSLSEDAPQLLEEMLLVVQEVGDLLGGENQGRLDRILVNVEGASEDFAKTLDDFSSVTSTITDFADEIGQFNATLGALTDDLAGVLENADAAVVSIGELSEQAKSVLTEGSETLADARGVIASSDEYITGDLVAMTQDMRDTLAELRTQASDIGESAQQVIATLDTTGTTATARLQQAEETLASVDALMLQLDATALSVTTAADQFTGLIQDEGTPLIAETRVMVAEANAAISSIAEAANTDLPAIVADIRSATESASAVIADVGENLSSSSENIDAILESGKVALDEASIAFANANETLAAINGALETGDRALAAAEGAFTGAEKVINEDLNGIIGGLETTLASLNEAIGEVSEDIPEITADLRAASRSASVTFRQLREVTAASGPAVADFTNSALPLYTRLAQETRTLIANLDRLTTQIERDPARFLLDRETPEFRR
ncbi:phospholipid/cholesterol/gamma-HCH transport system substrate-binding protein [Cognatiyoonia koreensis]|uniref:Phospholipid/cholesterol/gamma-HCH transport system substrate-binding protein n=1 Tax=Cognatiyoonia koreensis TaxID=364200 RepID=A0A1I0QTI7_9RHOB|nr:MlaD family protein [Cognatiyoonia koreensis]SEW30884.1 phospholipid/cholesterol/gamma-HCH transport system substrate-binding protein [Cognatiyoonia koreensis]